jgi:hypothetical protein
MSKSEGRGPLRSWASASYSPTTGRAAKSSMMEGAAGASEGASNQIATTHAPGKGGAPGMAERSLSKTGSGDPGRVKFQRS